MKMSLDEKKEETAYKGIIDLATIPRPNERKRICKEVIKICAALCQWDVQFPDDVK